MPSDTLPSGESTLRRSNLDYDEEKVSLKG